MASVDLQQMTQRWDRFLGAAQLRDPDHHAFAELVKAYGEPSRHYHDLDHIQHCLEMFDQVRTICPDPTAVEAAIWFHDIVYDATRRDNEEQSAKVARRMLGAMGANQPMIEEVDRLIMVTVHKTRPTTLAGQFLADIDLTTLGVPLAEFDAYGEAIRDEYTHLDDAKYFAGRKDFFRALLARPQIYYTDFFRTRYESTARANMQNTMLKLGA